MVDDPITITRSTCWES